MTDRTETFSAVLHNRHGWIEAPEGFWIEESPSGKSYRLCSVRDPQPWEFFPFGTRWNFKSILAVS